MGREAAARRWPHVVRWAVPFAAFLGTAAALHAQPFVTLGPAGGIAIAGFVSGVIAWFTARRLALPLLIVALLYWSGVKSELDAGTLVANRDRAVEFVFGRPIEESERPRTRAQAEQIVSLAMRREAELSVAAELSLAPGAPRPPEFAGLVERRAGALRDSISLSEWDRRVSAQAQRMERDRRGGFLPPTTDPKKIGLYLDALLETVAIAIWGTLLAVVLALPAALLGSIRSFEVLSTGATWPHRLLRRTGVFMTRRGFDACRGFNEFVLALIFVAILGLGPFAGVLALAVHTFGVLGKVFADAIETVRQGEIDGVTATGASSAQVLSYAVLPQIMPYVVSQSLLRFESNVRSASVLGLVGAGGIGYLIDAKMKSYQFQEVATMMILIIVVVTIIDFGCGRIMARFT